MNETRIDEFKEGVAALDSEGTSSGGRDQALAVIGLLLMLSGPVIGIVCYFSAVNLEYAEDQNELIILTMAGLGLSLVGLGLFLRYSLGRFLRFYLLRQLYEGQANRDEITRVLRER